MKNDREMILRICFLGAVILGFSESGLGQTSRDVSAPGPSIPQYRHPAQHAGPEKKAFFLFRLFKGNKGQYFTNMESRQEFERRMRRTVRQKAKSERESMKPRYKDPAYFGHKKPPKKRGNGKKKFCKECGLWH